MFTAIHFDLRRLGFLIILILSHPIFGYGQKFLSDIDSSFFVKDSILPIVKRFENLHFTGYIQPQFQAAGTKGAASYNGGNFAPFSSSRFMLRRARVKIDYLLRSKGDDPSALFSFQWDATERGVVVRDMFLKLFTPGSGVWSGTAGVFARPFGFEVNFSSAFREAPERGRMSQILMPTERDLGAMVSYEPKVKRKNAIRIKWDLGVFNGQGLSGTTDFDSRKDIISRLYIKPHSLGRWELSGGLSFLQGGWLNGTKYLHTVTKNSSGGNRFQVDSSLKNLNGIVPRRYRGADVQIKWKHGWGDSEIRAEYWWGKQPGTELTTSNPGGIPSINGVAAPVYLREFDGAFFVFLQHLGSFKHQFLLKHDWYDPNRLVKGLDIGGVAGNFNATDIRYGTWGIGYIYMLNPATRLIFYVDRVRNEITSLTDYRSDRSDNIFTTRLHFRF